MVKWVALALHERGSRSREIRSCTLSWQLRWFSHPPIQSFKIKVEKQLLRLLLTVLPDLRVAKLVLRLQVLQQWETLTCVYLRSA